MSPKAFMVSGNKLVVDIPGVKSRVRPSVIPVRKGGLDKVRVGQHAAPDQKVRVVMDLTKPMQYTVTPEENTVLIAMNVSSPAKSQEPQPQERAAAPGSGEGRARGKGIDRASRLARGSRSSSGHESATGRGP